MLKTRNYIVVGIVVVLLAWMASPRSVAERVVSHKHVEHVYGNDSVDTGVRSRHDTLMMGDSIIVIHTVCAPICSSHARVYNKEWKLIRTLKAPFKSVFPEAYIEDKQLRWRDNDTLDYSPIP